MSPPKASVVVLTLNAGPGFEDLLRTLRAQRTDFDHELLVLDSGSTDGTVEIAERYGASVHRVRSEDFGHGATRNLGASLARGEYVAFLVQDALPLDEGWLAAMVENLERDSLVAGVYGRQLPRPESGPLTRALVGGWPTASTGRREQFAGSAGLYRALPPGERRMLALFDNVSSCVRRSVWEGIPFRETRFGEDIRWGKEALEAGYKIVYEPRSAVYHSHERGPLYDLRRHYVEARVLLDLFGLSTAPDIPRLALNALRASAGLYLRLRRQEKGSPARFALLAARYGFSSVLGAYLAAKLARLEKASPALGAAADRLLSGGV